MAITSESQILNVQKVKNATAYLDDAVRYLNQAKESLLNGKEKCGANALLVDDKPIFVQPVDSLIKEIEDEIRAIMNYSTNIKSDANTISTSERKSYNKYLEDEKKKKEEAEKAAKNETAAAAKA